MLNSHRIRYLLVGGYAVGYYGYPRATADMDIWVATDAENVKKVIAALEDLKTNKAASGRHKDLNDLEHLP